MEEKTGTFCIQEMLHPHRLEQEGYRDHVERVMKERLCEKLAQCLADGREYVMRMEREERTMDAEDPRVQWEPRDSLANLSYIRFTLRVKLKNAGDA